MRVNKVGIPGRGETKNPSDWMEAPQPFKGLQTVRQTTEGMFCLALRFIG
jgi:hypothetical protein